MYISRIPPHMKPHKLRQLLQPHGALGRVYCAPEDPAARRLRKQKGGNSGAWVPLGWGVGGGAGCGGRRSWGTLRVGRMGPVARACVWSRG